MLESLKLLLNITETNEDNKLILLIDLATSDFEDLTNAIALDNENIVLRMAKVMYQKLGREDIKSESYDGADYDYKYPADLLRVIESKSQVIIW